MKNKNAKDLTDKTAKTANADGRVQTTDAAEAQSPNQSPKKENNDFVTSLAVLSTRLFSPITSIGLALIILYSEYIAPTSDSGLSWLLASLFIIVLAIVTLLIFMKIGLVSNWDVTDRRQRPRLLAIFSFYIIAICVLTWYMGYTEALNVLLIFLVGFTITTIITLFWKISFHTFAVTFCAVFILQVYDSPWLYPILLMPLITAWSRVLLKKHTVAQTVGGIVVAAIIATIGITYLN